MVKLKNSAFKIESKIISGTSVHIINCSAKSLIILRPSGPKAEGTRLIGPMAMQLGTAPQYVYLDNDISNEAIFSSLKSIDGRQSLTGDLDLVKEIKIAAAIEALNSTPIDDST